MASINRLRSGLSLQRSSLFAASRVDRQTDGVGKDTDDYIHCSLGSRIQMD